MMTIIRHVMTAFLFSFLLISVVLVITFYKFPITNWERLFTEKLFNIPYIWLVLIFTLLLSTIIGFFTSQFWKQRIDYVERQLQQLNQSQTLFTEESYKELKKVDVQLKQMEEKLHSQIEQSQRLASERAQEREKSLQEVVLQERNRLARELHDSVSQQLFAASMMMSAINEQQKDEQEIDPISLKHQLSMVEKMIHQSQLEMRALLLHLRPVALKGKALHEGIKDLLNELSQRITLEINTKIEVFPVEKGVEDELFRILQEAISNTLRHANATKLEIMLIKRDQMIILRVVDDGVGFDMTEKTKASSYGLQNMKERTNDLGGTLKIVSLPNKGTRLEVKVPYIEQEGE